MKQGEDNQKQNVTLLVFTVVTVIFVSSVPRDKFDTPFALFLLLALGDTYSLFRLLTRVPVANVLHIQCIWYEQ